MFEFSELPPSADCYTNTDHSVVPGGSPGSPSGMNKTEGNETQWKWSRVKRDSDQRNSGFDTAHWEAATSTTYRLHSRFELVSRQSETPQTMFNSHDF